MPIRLSLSLLLIAGLSYAAPPPLVCPAGGPVGTIELKVGSARGPEPLPLRNVNRVEEGDVLLYRPVLRANEQRRGEVALVLVPVNPASDEGKLVFLDPKPANAPQEWKVPIRTAVVAYVYGPAGLSRRKVKDFLSRDDELVAQLADYAEKTAQTEALLSALAAPNSSSANLQSALEGFSSKYGLTTQIDRAAPTDQQALLAFRSLNPVMSAYDPITSTQFNQSVSQTAGLATSVAALFFGSPVGLAAGGAAMLLQLRGIAYPNTEFRSSFAEAAPNGGLGLCGKRDPTPSHTRVAYLWASRIPDIGPPNITIERQISAPPGAKSPVPVSMADVHWKYLDRARDWTLTPESGKSVAIKVQKGGPNKELDLDLSPAVKPGRYRLAARWDWDEFKAAGFIDVAPLSDFKTARLHDTSQDLLVARTGKLPVVLEGADFEFVTKVELEKLNDKFAAPAPIPFVLPLGLRRGSQDRMDVQVNTAELDSGSYELLISQLDGKPHPVLFKILAAPPKLLNLPVVLNQGVNSADFVLKGERLDLVTRLEVANGSVALAPASADQSQRLIGVRLAPGIAAGTSLVMKAYIRDRSEPLTFADAVRVVGPRPRVTGMNVSPPPRQSVTLGRPELPGGAYLSAMLRVEQLQSNSVLRLGCLQPGGVAISLHLGQHTGAFSLEQLAPDQVFLSFDTGAWLNGCALEVVVANGSEGESDAYSIGRIVRVPRITRFEIPSGGPTGAQCDARITGQNLETIEKLGWSEDQPITATELPVPLPGDAQTQMQTMLVQLPAAPAGPASLYVWLRGETAPRPALVRVESTDLERANPNR